MNIFFLAWNPIIAASMMCDKHIIKMILESIQLLWSSHYFISENLDHLNLTTITPYKKTHFNHPSSKWVRQNINHYQWLCDHVKALHDIYFTHFGEKEHKSYPHIVFLLDNQPNLPDEQIFIQVTQAMPEIYKTLSSVHSYRNYYNEEKTNIITYRCSRELPFFLISYPEITHQYIKIPHKSGRKRIKTICNICEYEKK